MCEKMRMMLNIHLLSLLINLLSPPLPWVLAAPTNNIVENYGFVSNYLYKFGYLQNNLLSPTDDNDNYVGTDQLMFISDSKIKNETIQNQLKQALFEYQEFYHLNTTGNITDETLQLMAKPRCQLQDQLSDFTINKNTKWLHQNITYRGYFRDQRLFQIVRKAFQIWAEHANLNFIESPMDRSPNIFIVFTGNQHLYYVKDGVVGKPCTSSFDGPGGVLAHANLPEPYANNQSEIHLDISERWSYIMFDNETDSIETDSINLLRVVTHEIGHSLGLYHSGQESAIMYAYYNSNVKLNTLSLDVDDIYGIQSLYGKKRSNQTKNTKYYDPIKPRIPTTNNKNNSTITTTTTTAVTFSSSSSSSSRTTHPTPTTTVGSTSPLADNVFPDLCAVQHLISQFLIIKNHFYIFYKQWVWLIRLDKPVNNINYMYSKPLLIRDWLTFLPKNFSSISLIYHKPASNVIIIIIKNLVYAISSRDLKLSYGYPKTIEQEFRINQHISIGFSTYHGTTYLFLKDNTYVTFTDNCYRSIRDVGIINEKFTGLPSTGKQLRGAIRFINGKIYFFTKKSYYEYNEFTNSLIRAGNKDLSIFGITCPKQSIIDQLKHLLSKFVSLYSDMENFQAEDDNDDEDDI